MASEIVRSNITAIVSEAPSSSDRGLKLKHLGEQILERSCDGEKGQEDFDHFWLHGYKKSYRELQADIKLKVDREPNYGQPFKNYVFRVVEF